MAYLDRYSNLLIAGKNPQKKGPATPPEPLGDQLQKKRDNPLFFSYDIANIKQFYI